MSCQIIGQRETSKPKQNYGMSYEGITGVEVVPVAELSPKTYTPDTRLEGNANTGACWFRFPVISTPPHLRQKTVEADHLHVDVLHRVWGGAVRGGVPKRLLRGKRLVVRRCRGSWPPRCRLPRQC